MRILITGAGMVGTHAARELVEGGDDVTIVDVAPRDAYVRDIAGSAVRLEQADITDLPALRSIARRARPDVVVHTAALIGEAAQVDPLRGARVNVDGALNVAEVVRTVGVRRLVHASTLGVNDLARPQTAPIDEDFPIGSSGRVYGASKVAAEVLLDAWANAYGFELAILRFAGVYGRGHFAGGSGIGREIDELVRAALRGEPATVGGGIPASYEVVHVKDVARGVAAAVRAERLEHRVFNIGTGVLVTPSDVAEAVRSAFPTAAVEVGPARPDRYPRTQPLDLTRSREALGYQPQLDLVSGLRDLAGELTRAGTGSGELRPGRGRATRTEVPGGDDLGVTLTELWAHLGDVLSEYQDRVATEAYLETSRGRRGVASRADIATHLAGEEGDHRDVRFCVCLRPIERPERPAGG